MLGDSYSGLKMALSRFENSKEALDTVSATPEGASHLSLHVTAPSALQLFQ